MSDFKKIDHSARLMGAQFFLLITLLVFLYPTIDLPAYAIYAMGGILHILRVGIEFQIRRGFFLVMAESEGVPFWVIKVIFATKTLMGSTVWPILAFWRIYKWKLL